MIDAGTGKPLDPPDLVTDELIEMSDWELHDFAVQVVRNTLTEEEEELRLRVTVRITDRSLCLVRNLGTGEEGYVVVRGARYPNLEAPPPEDPESLIEHCAFRHVMRFSLQLEPLTMRIRSILMLRIMGIFCRYIVAVSMPIRFQGLVPSHD